MRKTATLTRAIQRSRKKEHLFPKMPNTFEEMSVPEHLTQTVSGERFLLYEGPTSEESLDKMIIFSSREQLDVMSGAEYWIADGTFDIVNQTLFYQLFVVTAVTSTGITIPCLFSLLPNKSTNTYQKVFEEIKEKGVLPPKGSFKTDFEQGIIKGFENAYPGVAVRCCDTHWKRAIRRKIVQDYGLGSLYNTNAAFQTLVRYLWGLSLVPVEDVVSVWENFIGTEFESMQASFAEEDQASVEAFLGYFERTWVGNLNQRTWIRRAPLFKHDYWNKYSLVLEEDILTSNAAEGFNNALSSSVPRNASVWTLIQQLRTEESLCIKKIRDAALGPQNIQSIAPNTSRNKRKSQRAEDLKSLVSNYRSLPIKLYLSSLVDFYND